MVVRDMRHIRHFKRWLRKWLMFLVALLIGNKVYGSKFDDGKSWRINGYGMLPVKKRKENR